ncbi:S-layer homology domain-containing protein [Lysinibacillus fusiformis]|uniref:S-layer homology domain-containing protein n=1 Tax=Lysinibacillus fusiformis TaxID=28031 RepID=UPI00263A41D9|nr:S-layer homology domain-containing protein [Lysinibacillus fusiformis]MDC6270276.1 S-layer homology domain-containing protein [Lysinibacillus sphaericus]MDN4971671.1 S-layer homology domain-containing protein [Lysinibacillus fusiformis]
MAKQNKGRKFFAASATAALVASAIVPVASAAQVNDYNKISDYAKEAVQSLVDAGVIQGDTNGNFNPLNTVTRAQAAEIFTKALELEADGDVNFKDVKKGAWYYNSIAAVVANGIFEGVSATEFAPNKSLTRSEAAKILVEAFGLEGSADLSQFADASSVKPWAKSYLETAVANGVIQGSATNGKTSLNPNASITRQDFALVFARTLELVETPAEATAVKAINNTTVEVTFEDAVENVKALDFKIDGLEIKNAAVKQTNKKVVVLTTAAQTADKEYVVTLDGENIGKFKGVAAVIPTAITFVDNTYSIQATNGSQVTVKAQVTVPDGQSKKDIPVTFNVYTGKNNDTAINPQIVGEAVTDENGVATYTYTRYNGDTDYVDAYATGAAAKKATAKVYWTSPIGISDVTKETTVANNAKKVYQITGKKNTTVYVAFEENLNVTPDKGVTTAKVEGFTTWTLDSNGNKLAGSANGYPYEFTTGGKAVTEVLLDANGKANLVVTGVNASVTPVVYEVTDAYAGAKTSSTTSVDFSYDKTAKQVKGSKVTFQQTQILGLTVAAEGKANAATWKNAKEMGGRDYVATVKTAAGAAAVGTPVRLAFNDKTTNNLSTLRVYDVEGKEVAKTTSGDVVYFDGLTTNSKGEVKFTVTNSAANAFATPTVFIENGTKAGLDSADLQQVSEITYFSDVLASDYTSKLVSTTSTDTTEVVTAFGANDDARFAYQLSDQNGKPRAYDKATSVSFQVTNTGASALTVTVGTQVYTVSPGGVGTYNADIVAGATEAVIYVKGNGTSSATVIATPSTTGLALGQVSANVTFASGATTTAFSVDKVKSTNGVATADVVTFTFNENVNVGNVTVIAGSTVAALQADATNAKVLRATFVNPLVSGTANNQFKVSYAGKVYTFELQADGTFKQI